MISSVWSWCIIVGFCVVSLSTFSHCNTFSNFFDRERELAEYRHLLDYPSIIAVTGPRNAGKTWLIKKLLMDYPAHIHSDLRVVPFKTNTEFCETIRNEFLTWYEKLKQYFTAVKLGLHLVHLELGSDNTCKLQEVLKQIEVFLEQKLDKSEAGWFSSLWPAVDNETDPSLLDLLKKQQKFPIIWIDEANRLDILRQNPGGSDLLHELFQWFVRVTKQDAKFVVLLSASDSFFVEWLSQRGILPYVKTYVVGDLDKESARKYFDHLPCTTTKPDFEEVYRVFGGRMYDIQSFLLEWREGSSIDGYPPIIQAVSTFKYALDTKMWHKQHPDLPPPEWTSEDWLTTMQMLSKECFISRSKLEDVIGTPAVLSLLQHNLLHYRPTNRFAFDITEPEALTPERPFECISMRKLLEKLEAKTTQQQEKQQQPKQSKEEYKTEKEATSDLRQQAGRDEL